jgi:hypothetical protein
MMLPEERDKYATTADVWAAWDIKVFIIDRNPATFGLLQPVLDDDFMARHGYSLVAEFPGERVPIQIYAKMQPGGT